LDTVTQLQTERHDLVLRALGAFLAAVGVLNIASAILAPVQARLDFIGSLVPLAIPHVARVLAVLSGLLLLFGSRQVARGKRRAWQAAVSLLAVSVVLHVVKGLDVEEAAASLVLLAALVAARRRFRAASDAPSFARVIRLAPLLAALPFAYGLAGLWLRRSRIEGGFNLTDALIEVGDRLVWLSGPIHYREGLRAWFPSSITALGSLIALYVLFLVFRPVVLRGPHRSAEDESRLRQLLHAGDSLSYFQLRDDKAAFFDSAGISALAYRPVGGVALISGDPAGPRSAWRGLISEFGAYAHERGWRVAAIANGEAAIAVWEELGYSVLYLGDEAIVEPDDFTLDGRRMRKVRQAMVHVARAGYVVEWHRQADVHPDLRRALLHISEAWLGGDEERGFSMSLGRLFDPRDPDCLVAVARDANGYARGFLHFVPAAGNGWSLDVMRRDHDTPGGLNEFLIAKTLEHLRAESTAFVSLNFAFLRGVLRPTKRLRPSQHLQRWLALRLGPWFQIESLYRFNNKFDPEWRPRYAAYEGALSVPAVLLAALRAERLLDFSILRRGQGGKRARRKAA
jgi:lysyl-tRNA synthetase class 2